ncbi:MAG: formylglycine-generating enzyme family protein [Pseudomonadales bacterium]|nr:formylglycine-generating enzyme family protein [Pseudomonadales bacterium]
MEFPTVKRAIISSPKAFACRTVLFLLLSCYCLTSSASSFETGSVFTDPVSASIRGPLMVVIPEGSFMMGVERGVFSGPPYPVTLTQPFAMGQTPVTVGQFKAFVSSTGYKTDAERNSADLEGCLTKQLKGDSWKNPGFEQTDAHPVVCISWNDAKSYVAWLSNKTGFNYRLPSESEWEYAASAGTNNKYGFGDDVKKACEYANVEDETIAGKLDRIPWFANKCNDGAMFTSPVASYKPNLFGLYDMYGNVLEWMEDCGYYSYKEATNDSKPNYSSDCSYRSIRSSSWLSGPSNLEIRDRGRTEKDKRTFVHGFRVVRDLVSVGVNLNQ